MPKSGNASGALGPFARGADFYHLPTPSRSKASGTRNEENAISAASTARPVSIVLVHGGFVDGSDWQGVYDVLKKDGYSVSIVQNPTISLADDVAVTKRAIAAQAGPVVLVGHSYGGAVITEAGNDPKVAALVYITAFAPDRGESVSTLIKDPPPNAPVPPILPPQDGFLFLDKAKFAASGNAPDRDTVGRRQTGIERAGRVDGGAEGDRTLDLRIANATLSQLSYRPTRAPALEISRPSTRSEF
jgi:pimeloyl-ACP methyl ester carboxylesterase